MLTINRAALAHGLKAVLEHVGDQRARLDWVGYDSDAFYATDGYSFLMWCPADSVGISQDDWKLPTKEAKDLLRFIRPTLKRHDSEEVQLLDAQNPETGEWELHVGLFIPLDETVLVEQQIDGAGEVYDSAVFSLHPPDYSQVELKELNEVLRYVTSHLVHSSDWVLQSSLVSRFKTAEVEYGDRTHWYYAGPGKHGEYAAVVTVGSEFIGAVAGLGQLSSADIPPGTETRDASLEDWGLGETE